MKVIIAPTDFSPTSLNAVEYAADLALATHCSLAIIHIYEESISAPEALAKYNPGQFITDAERELEKLAGKIKERTRHEIDVTTGIRQGTVLSELYNYCHSLAPWLIVMGAEKADAFERLVVGGNTTDAIGTLQWPLIIVPPAARFRPITRIGLACDLRDVEKTIPVQRVSELVNEFGAGLYILHVNADAGDEFSDDVIDQKAVLRNMLKDLQPRFRFIRGNKVKTGLAAFAEEHAIDLLILIPKTHGFIHTLFHRSTSKQVALATQYPVLFVHE